MAKKVNKDDLKKKQDDTWQRIKSAAQFASLDNPEVEAEIRKAVADHAGEDVPADDDAD